MRGGIDACKWRGPYGPPARNVHRSSQVFQPPAPFIRAWSPSMTSRRCERTHPPSRPRFSPVLHPSAQTLFCSGTDTAVKLGRMRVTLLALPWRGRAVHTSTTFPVGTGFITPPVPCSLADGMVDRPWCTGVNAVGTCAPAQRRATQLGVAKSWNGGSFLRRVRGPYNVASEWIVGCCAATLTLQAELAGAQPPEPTPGFLPERREAVSG